MAASKISSKEEEHVYETRVHIDEIKEHIVDPNTKRIFELEEDKGNACEMDEDNHSRTRRARTSRIRKRSSNSSKQNTPEKKFKVPENPLNKNIKINFDEIEQTAATKSTTTQSKQNKKKDTTSKLQQTNNTPSGFWEVPIPSDLDIPQVMESLDCNGVTFKIGDIVSVMDETDHNIYYAMIRGLLKDAFLEKSCVITWLIPSEHAPSQNPEFDPKSYIIGPDEEYPRRLELFEFEMRNPGGFYAPRFKYYPKLSADSQKEFFKNRLKECSYHKLLNNHMNLNKYY